MAFLPFFQTWSAPNYEVHYITSNLLSSKKITKNVNAATGIEIKEIKSNFLLHLLQYIEARNELEEPISTLLRPSNTIPFEEMLQWW